MKLLIIPGIMAFLAFGLFLSAPSSPTISSTIPNQEPSSSGAQGTQVWGFITWEFFDDAGNLLYKETAKNIITDNALEALEDATINMQGLNVTILILGNTSVPSTSDTYHPGNITNCGLSPVVGNIIDEGTGNWTVWYYFTSTCDNVAVNTTGLQNVSGIYWSGTSLSTTRIMHANYTLNLSYNRFYYEP
jgi:hypothetical protein